MAKLSKKELLELLKCDVEDFHDYFSANIKRFHEFSEFTFNTSLSPEDVQSLQDLGKPTIEFNSCEAFVSRLLGEFAEQEPKVIVSAADGISPDIMTPDYINTIRVVEDHMRAIFNDTRTDMLGYSVFSDMLGGGYSCMEVYTEYASSMSFDQLIKIRKPFDVTMIGFDPLARLSHKGDGKYCYQLFPMRKEEYMDRYGSKYIEDLSFSKSMAGFSWSYRGKRNEEYVLVCEMFKKKSKKTKIVKLTNGFSYTEEQYNRYLEVHKERGMIGRPFEKVEERYTMLDEIRRYRFSENRLLEEKPTCFTHLPLVFFDGNSKPLQVGNVSTQMTRPFAYHVAGIQRLKNFAGQTLANELENLVQHKFVVAIESVPEQYREAYENVQKADTLFYKQFPDLKNPEVQLNGPREINRTPIPPQIMETFRSCDEMMQSCLGSYDSSLGINKSHVSGSAIAKGSLQSNQTSKPFNIGYARGLNRVAEIVLDLLPKYAITPRTIPVIGKDGARSYRVINSSNYPNPIFMNFEPNSLKVQVSCGVNFEMQKQVALEMIERLQHNNPQFAEFINSQGLQVILDNIDIRGIDELKERAVIYEKQLLMQKAEQDDMAGKQARMQLAMMEKQLREPTVGEIEMMKMQEKSKKDSADVGIKQEQIDMQFLKMMNDIKNEEFKLALKQAEIDAENVRTAAESLIDVAKHKLDVKKHEVETNAMRKEEKTQG